ncbi:MAG: M28 family peptidase [Candidatus Kapabacteria bacterium]|nr:M28 family peptidase [Ignavibacteriota bacterium]MCW5883429.1 M28 family peptidase [Candidatus Kapabacteria bacterium]
MCIFTVISSYGQYNLYYNQKPDRENLRKVAYELAADEFWGRGTGQKGGFIAADYLAAKFGEIGLKQFPGYENFEQNVPLHEITVQPESVLELYNSVDTILPEINFEYLVHKTGSGTIIPKPVEMVFAGFGISAPEYDYNDYRNINVLNKIVVCYSGEPESDDDIYFMGNIATKHSNIDIKQRTALAQGAKACIIIPNPIDFDYEEWTKTVYEYSFPELSLAYSPSDILTLLIQPEIASKLFAYEKYDYETLSKMFFENKLISFEMKSKMTFRGFYKDRIFFSPNIIGYLEGSDSKLKQTCVIVTAHYDHLGIGPAIRGDSIYNGMLDNAMGVSSLLEIARIMQKSEAKPLRSVVFMLTTAEEKGLLGSLHYLNYPAFPLYKTIANINIDGMAFIDNFNSVVGIGSKLSELDTILRTTARNMNLYLEEFPQEFIEIESFNRSDQIAFASAGIPGMMVMDGTHYKNVSRDYGIFRLVEYMAGFYHTPFDDTDILINWHAAVQHTHLLMNLIATVAMSETEPEWAEWTNYYYERIKLKNEKR